MQADRHFDSVHVTPKLHERRERVFLVFAGIFLGSMAMLNILGITKFIHLGPLALAVGVLPYPLTFLCTDFISEFYGRRRANFVVWVGLLLNGMIILFLWVGDQAAAIDEAVRPSWLPDGSWTPPSWQTLHLSEPVRLANGETMNVRGELFHILYACTRGTVLASMLAYLASQFCDVFLFHFWKKVTRGRHLWLRNNGSTLISQLVDSTAVILVTFWADFRSGDKTFTMLLTLIGSSYLFKATAALLDTIPFYVGVGFLKGYLQIDPTREHDVDTEELAGPSGPPRVPRT